MEKAGPLDRSFLLHPIRPDRPGRSCRVNDAIAAGLTTLIGTPDAQRINHRVRLDQRRAAGR
jgi:hypothetical protein